MPAINASAYAHVSINDRWLEHYADEGSGRHYFDLLELAKSSPTRPCRYLYDLQGMGEISAEGYREVISRAAAIAINGINNGIYLGTSGHITGRLLGDTWTDRWHNMTAGIVHPLRFTRIYPVATTARQIKLVGVAEQ